MFSMLPSMPQPARSPHLSACLHKRVVRTTEHSLRLPDGIDLACASGFSLFVVLEEEVAVSMQSVDVILRRGKFFLSRCLRICERLKLGLHVGLRETFVGESFSIFRALICRILHVLLVVLLGILLFHLCLCHLLVEFLDQHIHHCQDTAALLPLLLVAGCLRWWWGGLLVRNMSPDL